MKTRSALLVSLALVLALAGCNPGPQAVENFSGTPNEHDVAGQSPDGGMDAGVQAFWLQDGGRLGVTIWGSSTCPVIATGVSVDAQAGEGNTVTVSTAPLPDRPCTMDYVPHTTVFWTPVHVTTTEPLVVRVGKTEVTLPIK